MPKKVTKQKYYIGIDVGKNGAIAVQNSATTEVITMTMPLIKDVLDFHALHSLLLPYQGKDCHVVFEDLRAIFKTSAGSTFTFGHVAGATEMCVVSLGLPYTKTQAKKWQAEMFVGIPKMTKPSSTKKTMVNDTKGMALLAVKRLFPTLVLTKSKLAKNPHDGIVDAVLMSEYCKRNYT